MKIRRRVTVKTQWKCDKCGHVTVGKPLTCPECGDIKERHEHYSLPGVLEKTEPSSAGPNKICHYCNANVPAEAKQCGHCGGDLTQNLDVQPNFGPDVTSTSDGQYQPQPKASATSSTTEPKRVQVSRDEFDNEPMPSFRPKRNWAIIVIVGLAAIVIASFVTWACGSHEVQGEVTARSWACTTTLYRTTDENDSGWCNSMPGNAKELNRDRRQNGTENCEPYECVKRTGDNSCNCREVNCRIDRSSCSDNSNGTASCDEVCDRECDKCPDEMGTCYKQCPVYEDWCEYRHPVERAVGSHTATKSDDFPICPEVSTAYRERTGTVTGYSITVTADGKSHEIKPDDLSEYRGYHLGDRCTVTVGNLGDVRSIRLAD